ncbi:hypothetical protein ASPWEDRAFT_52085 [Aspergillus wentii DTO 134E9]|uniref:Acyl-coenzyme A oxidase n=1 Tax=Aspergillus wentii DTO 134E9 TaxID=1073089 RepID=A0A1L9RFJ5_ASPWE|nr:uncharacterized protein ASPWEDRAFT_52085 [Aspergillus wentii DTO 134E9]KAI9925412.1 hypothetical protein MW887_005793 [Aspergillus wentii]OJJ33643.1 hypothetical protein ASPWEDRAFT_52085 [Aspergillus wentii DTO 134E9]
MVSNRQTALMGLARQTATFDSSKLTVTIYDDEETVQSRRAAFHRIESSLGLLDNMKLPHVYADLDREGLYLEGVRRARAITEDMLVHGHKHFESMTERYHMTNATPFGLNFLMFRKTIELQGAAMQKEEWLPLIDQMKINGAYVQTELSHGTFVRGIETTATFDRDSDGFILNSPTLTSIKYWPGGLGLSCSHAVIVARLITNGKDHGMHWFVVQIRSLEDHSVLDGVELGDIGIKMGYNGTCNGYARFNQLRIPRKNLLAAHVQVLADGTYIKNAGDDVPLSKRLYATMLDVRCAIIESAAFALAQAVTVASRYSIVREQGSPMFDESNAEFPIVAYKSQHYRLLTVISQAYAILFASKEFSQTYRLFVKQRADSNFSLLSTVHALSTGLKAWSTGIAAAGAEEARKMCGGHGYVAMSGLPEMVATVSAMPTFEGENYVMWQQLGRYLFKQVDLYTAGKEVDANMQEFLCGFNEYLNELSTHSVTGDLSEPSTLLSIYLYRARALLATAYREFTEEAEVSSKAEAWNSSLMAITAAGHAYTVYIVLRSFQSRVATAEANLQPVLSRLCNLFALTTIVSPTPSFYSVTFFEAGILSPGQLSSIRKSINPILEQLLPDIIALTDAWDFTDASLCSALGCSDGNAYERLMSWTRQLPVNNGNIVRNAWEGGLFPGRPYGARL